MSMIGQAPIWIYNSNVAQLTQSETWNFLMLTVYPMKWE